MLAPGQELRRGAAERDRRNPGLLWVARKAAGGKDVALGGGAKVAQQYLAAGLIDEMEIHVVPLLLGGGARLFDHLGRLHVRLEPVRTVEGPGVTHLKYRIIK